MFYHKLSRVLALLFLVVCGSLLFRSAPVIAQAVTQAYNSDTQLQNGIIVRISPTDKTKVEALTEQSSSAMEGVVVAANAAPVTLSHANATQQQVFVANTGQYDVLVSNQNGVIKAGDYLTISSLAGIAMKAGDSQSLVIGKALGGFDGQTSVSASTTVTDSTGRKIPVALGLIPVNIDVSHNPLQKSKASVIPGLAFLQSGAQSIAGKSVAAARVYISVLLLLIAGIVAGTILQSGVRSALGAIGRNPLAKSAVMRGLTQVVLTSIIIFIIGLVGVYLILKL
jgi:hypothetical protein